MAASYRERHVLLRRRDPAVRRVRRADYVALDRHKLSYLNAIEKLNCLYCGYANGVIAYAREIASRTEQYWCPIKHARRIVGAHGRYHRFQEYGDAEGYQAHLRKMRLEFRREARAQPAPVSSDPPR